MRHCTPRDFQTSKEQASGDLRFVSWSNQLQVPKSFLLAASLNKSHDGCSIIFQVSRAVHDGVIQQDAMKVKGTALHQNNRFRSALVFSRCMRIVVAAARR
jgi:hypothetical protein